jgi:hypothetical protein
VLWWGRRCLRTRWPYLALLAALVGYGNMIVYNLMTGFWTLRAARDLQQSYAGGRPSDLDFYLANLMALVQSLARLLSGTIDRPDSPSRFLYLLLTLLGLVLLARRGEVLSGLAALSFIAVLPYFNPHYGPILSGRYLIPLLPLGFTALGYVVVVGSEAAAARYRTLRRIGWRPLAAALGLIVVLYPLAPLYSYYQSAVADGRTNRPLYRLVDSMLAARAAGETVLLDEGLGQEDLGAGGTDLKALQMVLGMLDIPYQVGKVSEIDVAQLGQRASMLVFMEAKKRPTLPRAVRTTPLSGEVASASGSEHRYALYRATAS